MDMTMLCDFSMYGSVYLLFVMAFFHVEWANLFVPSRVNSNYCRVVSRFVSFFKGYIGAGG